MPGQDSTFPLPPITPAYLQYTTFEWCQVRYVFARELTQRDEPLGWVQAYQEAQLVVKALQQSETPLAFGARPNEVVWSILACAANAYAHMNDQDRALVRAELAAGRPIWSVVVSIEEPDLCDRRVLEDPEYFPEPACVPEEPRTGVLGFVAGALGLTGYLLIMATFAHGNGKPAPRPKPKTKRKATRTGGHATEMARLAAGVRR